MITPEIEKEVLRIYHANPQRFSAFKAARKLGLKMSEIMEIIRKNKDTPAVEEMRYDGLGREDLRRFVVARRRVVGEWDNSDPNIVEARARFEEGTHMMATHRDGPWLLLLSIPRRFGKVPAPNYFQEK